MKQVELDQIQGNIFGGFSKDFQDFLLLKVLDATKARKWVRDNSADLVSTSRQVLAFNNAFKQLGKSGVAKPETVIQARWMNLAFSASGLKALGFGNADHGTLPKAFTDGMASRTIGDVGASEPSKWQAPFTPAQQTNIHAIVLVAADTEPDLNDHVKKIGATPGFAAAFTVIETVHGRTRVDEVGHEHFGFKDGVSQPGIRGIDAPDDPLADPDQGHPGQDLLWPGEFVLGYPTQIPKAKPGHDGPNPEPGPASVAGDAKWTKNGSFLVFRRLRQDVPAFHAQVGTYAKEHGLSVDLAGAKLVGRYRSGCPLEALSMNQNPAPPSPTDPGLGTPLLAESDALNNAFEYGDDPKGEIVPLAAHIRKAYPRDEITLLASPDDSESETQTHRLLRRGIPFGASFGAAVGGAAADARGLLFLAYQNDIEKHFEFVQQKWVNDPKFPPSPVNNQAGEDPLIAQSASGPFQLKAGAPSDKLSHFVTTTGGEYFFSPSLSTLQGF
jgi:Dyp-type peroxidase family